MSIRTWCRFPMYVLFLPWSVIRNVVLLELLSNMIRRWNVGSTVAGMYPRLRFPRHISLNYVPQLSRDPLYSPWYFCPFMRLLHQKSVSRRSTVAWFRGYGEIPYFTFPSFSFLSCAWRVTTCGSSKCFYTYSEIWEFTVVFSYRRTYKPASYHIAQELQKYNIPDYRPRQEQYVYLGPISTLHAHVALLAGSKKLSRKFVLCRGCDGIAGSLSVRPKTARNKTRRGSFELTTHPRVPRGPLGINGYAPRALLLDVRVRTSLFSCRLLASTGILFYVCCLSWTLDHTYTPPTVRGTRYTSKGRRSIPVAKIRAR